MQRSHFAHFGPNVFRTLSIRGTYGFRSKTGVSLKASIESIRMTLFSMDRILQTDRPTRLGLRGERVANTPVNGLLRLPLG